MILTRSKLDMLTRREWLGITFGGVTSALLASCKEPTAPYADGRLGVEPAAPTLTIGAGTHALELGPSGGRDGVLHVPTGYAAATPAPLVVLLHGATGSGAGIAAAFQALADELGVVLLAPDSRQYTWEIVLGGFGPDTAFVARALAQTFERVNVDPARMAIAGFSDGASYALSLGVTNGDLFTDLLAWSPGFIEPGALTGRPPVFVSHGISDPILPIANTSRRIVPWMRERGYTVDYREFEGGHQVPETMARAALAMV